MVSLSSTSSYKKFTVPMYEISVTVIMQHIRIYAWPISRTGAPILFERQQKAVIYSISSSSQLIVKTRPLFLLFVFIHRLQLNID